MKKRYFPLCTCSFLYFVSVLENCENLFKTNDKQVHVKCMQCEIQFVIKHRMFLIKSFTFDNIVHGALATCIKLN